MPRYQVSRDALVVNTTDQVWTWVLDVRWYQAVGLGGTCSSQGHVDTTNSVGSGVAHGADWARMTEGGVGTAGSSGSAGVGGWSLGTWAEW